MRDSEQHANRRRSRPGHRPARQSEGIWLLLVAVASGLLFASGSIDIALERCFYSPGATDHWPLAREFPWTMLYGAASWITASLVIVGLTGLAASLKVARRGWRQPALLVLLAVAIGPGLLGNAVFKDHWRHPRPRELIEFGGSLHYVPAPLIGHEGGASFPCGHCTVGFVYSSGWWIWKRRRPVFAAASLVIGLLIGTVLGIGRLVAGAHFLSDIVWSALLAFGVVHILCYRVLRWGTEEKASFAPPARAGAVAAGARVRYRWQRWLPIAAVAGSAAVLIALFVAPHGTQLTARVPLSASSPHVLEIEADIADIAIVLTDAPAKEVAIDGELHGFGLPGSRLGAHPDVVPAPPYARVRYRIEARGWLTDVDGFATVRVPAAAFTRVIVTVRRGDIRIEDRTRAGVVRAQRVQLDLHTDLGRIQGPAPMSAVTAGER